MAGAAAERVKLATVALAVLAPMQIQCPGLIPTFSPATDCSPAGSSVVMFNRLVNAATMLLAPKAAGMEQGLSCSGNPRAFRLSHSHQNVPVVKNTFHPESFRCPISKRPCHHGGWGSQRRRHRMPLSDF